MDIYGESPVFRYEIPGDPIPQPRPRMGKYGVYNPASSSKKIHQMLLQQQHSEIILHTSLTEEHADLGVWSVQKKDRVCHWATLVKSYFNKEKKLPISLTLRFFIKGGNEKVTHVNKPDIDNLVKYAMDVANNILFADDSQIAQLHAFKSYGEPKTILEISFLPPKRED